MHPGKLADFLKRVEGTAHAQALNSLLLRAMQQASYQTTNIGHFALAAPDYLHFTSPIRRYPDLAVHRVVRDLVRKDRIDHERLAETLKLQAAVSSRLERRAMQVDREANDLYRAILMKDRVGESFDGTITGVAEHGLYVAFDEPFVDARVPIDTLGEDWYELDSLGLRLVGRRSGHSFALGDRLTVRLERVSIAERELTAVIEQKLPDDRDLLAPRGDAEPRRPRSSARKPERREGKRAPERSSKKKAGARGGARDKKGRDQKGKAGPVERKRPAKKSKRR